MTRSSRSGCNALLVFFVLISYQDAGAQSAPPYQTGWPLISPISGSSLVGPIDAGGTPVVMNLGPPYGPTFWNADGSNLIEWVDFELAMSHAVGNHHLKLGDMNGDGLAEVVLFSNSGNWVHVYSGADGSSLPGWPRHLGEGTGWWAEFTALGDVDGDGDLELVGGGYLEDYGGAVFVYQHDGTDLPGWPQLVTTDTQNTGVSGVAVGDVDFDGDTEVVASTHGWATGIGWTPGEVFVFEHDGEVRPGWPVYPDTDFGFMRYPRIVDLDGDGLCEIVGNTGTSVAILGPFGDTIDQIYGPALETPCGLGDVDGDGTIDIIAGGISNFLTYSLNAGFFGFWQPTELQNINGFSAADVDGDGAAEVFCFARGLANRIYMFDAALNPAPGFPIESSDSTSGYTRHNTWLADLDGDNDVELTFTAEQNIHVFDLPNPSSNPIRIDWSGFGGKPTGSGYFHEGRDVPRFVRGDVNGDGAVEITDAVAALQHMFGGAVVPCRRAIDTNADDEVDIPDAIGILGELFGFGDFAIARPYPRCGRLTEGSTLECDSLPIADCPE